MLPRRRRKDPHEERRKREEWALGVIKAIQKSPSGPPEPIYEPPPPTHLAGAANASGLVYFVYCVGRIKIGYTTELNNRMNQFGTHGPMPPVLLLTIGADEEDEAAYHEMFAEDRAHREWFRLSYTLREFLESQFQGSTSILLFEAEQDFYEMMQDGTAHISEVMGEIEKELRNAD